MYRTTIWIILLTFKYIYCQNDDKNTAINDIFSKEFLQNNEEITPAPLESLGALQKCGEGEDNYVCVPYYNCNPSTNTVKQENVTSRIYIDIRAGGKCEHFLDVCCQSSGSAAASTEPSSTRTISTTEPSSTGTVVTTEPSTRPPSSEVPTGRRVEYDDQNVCGIRNSNGVNFTIKGNNDNEAEFGEFPWMIVVLRIDAPICGGSLIAPNVVLTAAHCVQNFSVNNLKVRAGEWDSQTTREPYPYQERNVRKIIVHENFNNGNLQNDIALLILDQSFTKTPTIGTVCLPNQDYKLNSRNCFATGWGKNVFGAFGHYSVILKKIQLPIIENTKCEEMLRKTRLGNAFKIHKSFLCAGGEAGVDTCSGDGGSPLVCRDSNSKNRYLQVGIVAWGIGCGESGIPGVYVDVSHFRNWIDQNIKDEQLSSEPYSVI